MSINLPRRPSLLRAASLPRLYLLCECLLVFAAFPIGLVTIARSFAPWLIETLVVTGIACIAALLLDPDFDRRRLWNADCLVPGLRRVLLLFLAGAAVVTVLVLWQRPDLFLAFPRQRTTLWLFVMVFYPLFSVYPQELIFRTFFFHRYSRVFRSDTALITASAIGFGLAHLFFGNWLAPVMSTIGGILFASTYARSRSTLQSAIDHSLWGDFIFTVGLGWYFYTGSVGA
ncbi:MAG: CPBP family intramembrane metalloprotease [Thermoanaerobaculia bacterium]|nr:CPBP family intramembrane metalloprotease [Thermoanaerobaculia bacterium]